MLNFWKYATEEEASRFKAHELLEEYRPPEAPKAPAVPTPTPRPVPTPTPGVAMRAPAAPRLPAFASQVQQVQAAQPETYGQALRQAVGQIPSLVGWGRQLLTPGQWPQGVPAWVEPVTRAYEEFRQQIARPASMLTQERIAAPALGELMRWNVPYRMLAPERAGPSPWAEIAGLAERAVGVGEPLPSPLRLPAFAKQRYEEARAYEETLPGAVRLLGRQLLDPLGLGGAWAASMLTGPLAALYKIVDMTDYTLFLISATPEERATAAGLIGLGVTARNLPEIRAFVKRVAGGAAPVMRRAVQEAAPAVQRFMAEEAGAADIPGRPGVPEPPEAAPGRAQRPLPFPKDKAEGQYVDSIMHSRHPDLWNIDFTDWGDLNRVARRQVDAMNALEADLYKREKQLARQASREGWFQAAAPSIPSTGKTVEMQDRLRGLIDADEKYQDLLAQRVPLRQSEIDTNALGAEGRQLVEEYRAAPAPEVPAVRAYADLKSALATGLDDESRVQGFGSVRLVDGSVVELNPLARVPDVQNTIMANDGSLIDANVVTEVITDEGKVIWRRPAVAPAPEAPPVRAVPPELAEARVRRTPMERVRVTDNIARLRAEISRATDPMERRFSERMLEDALEAQRRGVDEFTRPVSRRPERGYGRMEVEGVEYDVPQAMRSEDALEAIERGQVLEAPEVAPEVVPPRVAEVAPEVAPAVPLVPEGYRLHQAFSAIRHQYNRHALGQDARAKLSVMSEEEFVSFVHRLALETPDLTTDAIEQTALRLLADRPTPSIWGREIDWNRLESEQFPVVTVPAEKVTYEVPEYRPPAAAPVTRPVPPAVAPLAEPAVAPAAVPAVPPVTAQPVPAARGIPGPPLAPGAGAAVVAPAGRPVQPPLAAAGVQIAPGGPPAGAVPPAAPPPAGAPPPLGPGIAMAPAVGPARFAEMLPSSEILRLAQRPNNIRKLMDWAEQHPHSPLKWVLQHIGVSGTDPTSEATVLVNTLRVDSDAAVMGAVANLRAYGDSEALFDVQDNVAHIAGQAVAIGDLAEGRVSASIKAALSSEQQAYLAEGWAYFDDLERLAASEGVEIPKATYGPGEHYWARNVMGRMMPDGALEIANVRGAPSGRWLTALAGFERPRMFDTMEEALANDFRYFSLSDAAEMSGRAIYRRIANKRLLDYIVENIPSRVGKKPRYGEVTLPGIKHYFQAEDIEGVKKLLDDSPLTFLEEFADVVNAVNQLPRLLTTVFDLGPGMAQLYNMLCNFPKQWARAVEVSFRSAFEPVNFQRFLAQPEHAATVRRAAPYGLIVSGSELTEAARTTFGPTRFLGKIPLVGKAVRVGARVFDNMMTAGRILGIEATEYQVKSADDMSELVAFWNKATGMVEPGAQGISRRQQKLEAAVLFAPRLYRATFGLLFDIGSGGLRGSMARNSLAQMATVTLLGYVGLCGLLKQKRRLDPKEGSRWLTIQIGDQYVGIRGSLFMTLRVLAQMGRSPEDAQELAWRYARGRLSPVLSTAMDVYNRADFIGMPIETPLQLTKRIVVDNLTPFWVQGVFESGVKDWKELVAVGGAELAGLRTFPVSPARKRNEIRERLAQARFGKPWASLSRPETYELDQVPELREAVEQARSLAVERRQPWALFWADVDSQREPYRIEIAQLGQELRAGQRTGRAYREELTKRQMLMARIPETLQRTREYEEIRLEGREPENAVDRFIDAYYKIADEARDPLTGVADGRQIVMDREVLKTRTPDDVVRQAMGYINRNLDPQYVQARDLYYEYMRIPQYIGLSEDEAQRANETMRTYRDMRRVNPQMHPDWTRAILSRNNPEGYKLMVVAQGRRNPLRRRFWAEHPLLSMFYSDLTTEELELVLPNEMQGMWQTQPQAQLPAFAGSVASYGR